MYSYKKSLDLASKKKSDFDNEWKKAYEHTLTNSKANKSKKTFQAGDKYSLDSNRFCEYIALDITKGVREDNGAISSPINAPPLVISDKTFSFSKFNKCNFVKVAFINCHFIGVVFEHCQFHKTTFECCQFNWGSKFGGYAKETGDSGCQFIKCSFQMPLLKDDICFKSCDLQDVSFSQTSFMKIIFKTCDLYNSFFEKSDFKGCTIDGGNISSIDIIKSINLSLQISSNSMTIADEKTFVDHVIDLNNDCKNKRGRNEKIVILLKQVSNTFNSNNLSDLSGEYFFRAKNTERSTLEKTKKFSSWMQFYLCGYGERPLYTFFFIIGSIILFSVIYMYSGIEVGSIIINYNLIGEPNTEIAKFLYDLFQCLFFSITTFTTVGYGNYVPCSNLSIVVSSIQMILGISLSALWAGCIFRKISR